MGLRAGLEAKGQLNQRQALKPGQLQGIKYLQMNLPELRAELLREMSQNPLIEDVEPTLEKTTVSEQERELNARESADASDYPDDDALPAVYVGEEEALERRQRFLESRTKEETLEEHLLKQLAFANIPDGDRPLAEILIGDLDDNGWFAGSVPDIQMVTGESADKVHAALAKIRRLDPPGCGATTLKECLLAQTDAVDPSRRAVVKEMIERHLDDIAAGRLDEIARDLGISRAECQAALASLRALEPRPGRAYRRSGHGTEYVNPEVHAERSEDGRWLAHVDARSLPKIRLSPKYLALLEDPATAPDVKAYVRERIAAAKAVVEAVENRQQTVTAIAQAIFDAQPGFFEKGLKGLVPLTEESVAKTAGVSSATVSRTVRDKYASTPKGTVELRRFFISGVACGDGSVVGRDTVLDALQAIVDGEDKTHPLSDEKLAERLKARGFPVARRTVAKYRGLRAIPDAVTRSCGPK